MQAAVGRYREGLIGLSRKRAAGPSLPPEDTRHRADIGRHGRDLGPNGPDVLVDALQGRTIRGDLKRAARRPDRRDPGRTICVDERHETSRRRERGRVSALRKCGDAGDLDIAIAVVEILSIAEGVNNRDFAGSDDVEYHIGIAAIGTGIRAADIGDVRGWTIGSEPRTGLYSRELSAQHPRGAALGRIRNPALRRHRECADGRAC